MTDADKDALGRILAYAEQLQQRAYRVRLAQWEQEYRELMARKPTPPRTNFSTEDWT